MFVSCISTRIDIYLDLNKASIKCGRVGRPTRDRLGRVGRVLSRRHRQYLAYGAARRFLDRREQPVRIPLGQRTPRPSLSVGLLPVGRGRRKPVF
jgi:hypothetical protein